MNGKIAALLILCLSICTKESSNLLMDGATRPLIAKGGGSCITVWVEKDTWDVMKAVVVSADASVGDIIVQCGLSSRTVYSISYGGVVLKPDVLLCDAGIGAGSVVEIIKKDIFENHADFNVNGNRAVLKQGLQVGIFRLVQKTKTGEETNVQVSFTEPTDIMFWVMQNVEDGMGTNIMLSGVSQLKLNVNAQDDKFDLNVLSIVEGDLWKYSIIDGTSPISTEVGAGEAPFEIIIKVWKAPKTTAVEITYSDAPLFEYSDQQNIIVAPTKELEPVTRGISKDCVSLISM